MQITRPLPDRPLRWVRALAGAILLASLGLAMGCDSKDSGVGTNPGTGGAVDADQQALRDQALGTIGFVNSFVGDVGQFANGDFSSLGEDLGIPVSTGLRAVEEPQWNPTEGAWVLDTAGTETDQGATLTYDIYFALQFRDAQGVPQQQPDATTASFAFDVDMVMDLHAEENGEVFDLSFDIVMEMGLAGLPSGPFDLTASGTNDVAMSWTGFVDGDIDIAASMGWTMDVAMASVDACPVGSATVTFDQYHLDATYDGDTTYDWRLLENGVRIDGGSESIECGAPS